MIEIKNGCPHCRGGIGISPYNRKDLGVELHSSKKRLVVYGKDKYDNDISVSAKIKYCPMCGTKL